MTTSVGVYKFHKIVNFLIIEVDSQGKPTLSELFNTDLAITVLVKKSEGTA